MPCTTILVGRKASYDGSTMAARSEDAGGDHFDPKKFAVIHPEEQPKLYRSVLSHVEIELPDAPMRYTAVPNGIPDEGIWAAAGVNEAGVSMTATETITANERVLGADPLAALHIDENGQEVPGGIGEEDMVVLVLPYIRSAREGVLRLGSLLEKYGTYEMNGIALQDSQEIWWLETIGGHHWIARRLPDDCYAVIPNQLGIDDFDLADALGEGREHLCSADLPEFIRQHHLNLDMRAVRTEPGDMEEVSGNAGKAFSPAGGRINARRTFGTHSDSDHCYNSPRAWFAQRYLNPAGNVWDGMNADYTPISDDIPWARRPENKITPEDIKYILSSHYQDTPFDPYAGHGDKLQAGAYRSVGVNRNNFSGMVQLGREAYILEQADSASYTVKPAAALAVEWLTFGSNPFNAMFPVYTYIHEAPGYITNTTAHVTTENIYWSNRLIAVLADASYGSCIQQIERYQKKIMAKGHAVLLKYDARIAEMLLEGTEQQILQICEQANREMIDYLRQQTDLLLDQVLLEASRHMKNAYSRADH